MATTRSLLVIFSLLSYAEVRVNAYIGGIPLRTPGTCPAGSVVGQVTFEQNCCGADQTFVKVEGSVCCPNSIDCYAEVVAAPQCADPSWQLCGTNSGGFCCEEDWVCYTQIASGTIGAGVGCSTPGATLTPGLQSAVVTVYAANAGPGAATSSSAHPSLTSTSDIETIASASGTTTSLGGAAQSTSGTQSVGTGSGSGSAVKGTTSFSSSIAAPTSGNSAGNSSQGSPDSSLSTTKKSSSVSGGAIAGIAIGAALLLGMAFIGGVWFSRRKNRDDPLPMSNLSRDSIWAKWKLAGVSELGSGDNRGAELQGNVPGDHRAMSELPAERRPVEMYAGYKT